MIDCSGEPDSCSTILPPGLWKQACRTFGAPASVDNVQAEDSDSDDLEEEDDEEDQEEEMDNEVVEDVDEPDDEGNAWDELSDADEDDCPLVYLEKSSNQVWAS